MPHRFQDWSAAFTLRNKPKYLQHQLRWFRVGRWWGQGRLDEAARWSDLVWTVVGMILHGHECVAMGSMMADLRMATLFDQGLKVEGWRC